MIALIELGGRSIILILMVWLIAWTVSLYFALTNRDRDPVTKLMWVLVIILVPILGIIFYWAIGSRRS
jgi:hypothetical protein